MSETRRLLCSVLVLTLSLSMACAKRIVPEPPPIAPEPAPIAPKPSLFVLLPDADGRVGQLTVSNPEGTQVLDQAWQATEVESAEQSPGTPVPMDEREVAEIFEEALAAQPLPPTRFILYFQSGSAELTPESRDLLPKIIEAVEQRASVDTSVVGHTDTAGTKEFNYKLSLERAAVVGRMLTSRGVDTGILEIKSHGEEDLLVPTEDGVSEPRNRRVEVTVR